MLNQVLDYLAGDAVNRVQRLRELLTIPSVSTDMAFAAHVSHAAEWVGQTLREAGLQVTVHRTAGHPIVLAHTPEDPSMAGKPRVLFYGHYDVQPADPLGQWTTPAFEPTERGGAIYARGSSDDKGQICCFFEALRAWKKTAGKPPVPVTVLIEGEEECGSIHLHPFLVEQREKLRADIVVISDTGMWDTPGGPVMAITYGLRGLQYFDVQLHHTNRDLHSGVYGGTIANPAVELTAVLGRLFDGRHRVTIPGFYDDVQPLSADERRRWEALAFQEQGYLEAVGISRTFGETGYSTLERRWARPSCDINGLYGGYGGQGAKTIIPSYAGAKISFRLAPNQDPRKIAEAFNRWLQAQDVHGCRWKITDLGGADPVVVPTDSAYVAAASRAIQRCTGRQPVLMREGATIPVVADFKKTLGIDSLLIGFGLSDDRIHAPDEKFSLKCFDLGCQTHAAVLAELAGIQRG
jgi:acetylornithine deacetylase/succinyl-diaminopimelate desuccinylase-like protein